MIVQRAILHGLGFTCMGTVQQLNRDYKIMVLWKKLMQMTLLHKNQKFMTRKTLKAVDLLESI